MKTIHIYIKENTMQNQFLKYLRNRRIPSAFSYWGTDEANGWLKVCQSQKYNVFNKGYLFVKNEFKNFVKEINSKKINFISLGIGNGLKDAMIIDMLSKKHEVNYVPIDISLDMLEAGLANIPDNIESNGFVSEFQDLADITERMRNKNQAPMLVSILGNTIGNFGQVEILNSIQKGMRKNDFLLLEVTLRKESGSKIHGEDLTEIIDAYNNEDFKDFAFSSLKKAGFTKEDGVIEIEYGPNQFYPKLSTIETWFRLTKDKIAHYAGQEIIFKKDERIQIYISHKYTQENIRELLDGNGFEVINFALSDTGDYGLVLSRLR